jgi:hypothetical protein
LLRRGLNVAAAVCQEPFGFLDFPFMIDTASTQPAKSRITHSQLVRWQQEAAGFIEHGESPAGIHAYLQGQGCPPRMRAEVLRKARESVRGEHRTIGLKLFAVGVAATGLGAAMGYGAFNGVPVGDGARVYGGGSFKLAICLIIFGVPPLIYGSWKLLTGSTVLPTER